MRNGESKREEWEEKEREEGREIVRERREKGRKRDRPVFDLIFQWMSIPLLPPLFLFLSSSFFPSTTPFHHFFSSLSLSSNSPRFLMRRDADCSLIKLSFHLLHPTFFFISPSLYLLLSLSTVIFHHLLPRFVLLHSSSLHSISSRLWNYFLSFTAFPQSLFSHILLYVTLISHSHSFLSLRDRTEGTR